MIDLGGNVTGDLSRCSKNVKSSFDIPLLSSKNNRDTRGFLGEHTKYGKIKTQLRSFTFSKFKVICR